MRERVRAVANELERGKLPVAALACEPRRARCSTWMDDGHFVFLGYRYYRLKRGRSRDALVREPGSGLGILRDGSDEARRRHRAARRVRQQARATRAADPHQGQLEIARCIASSYLDYVGVKTFDRAGESNGEHRFLGLWTSTAYHRPPARDPGAAAQGRARHRALRAARAEPRREGGAQRASKLFRATSCSRRRSSELIRDRARHRQPLRAAHACACSCGAILTSASIPA